MRVGDLSRCPRFSFLRFCLGIVCNLNIHTGPFLSSILCTNTTTTSIGMAHENG